MKVLVIIPAYNEEENIKGLIAELKSHYPDYDYVVINDCSKDHTKDILRENGFNYVDLPVNLGIGGGVQTGYLYAVQNDYDIAVQMDGDGQHDPAYLGDLVEKVASGETDMCIGSRFIANEGFQSSALRRFGIRFLKVLIRICCGVTVHDNTSGFRATNKELNQFYSQNYAQDYPEPEAIIAAVNNGFRVMEVPVQMRERKGGVSSINPIKSVYYMIKVSLAIIIHGIFKGKERANGTRT
ncbi:MAG: glycosyltransferase family 2 protein [Oscillospiraceae bacterium]|nr:glycosyltransferase family 2 protein [Oscillospiraceae bacterium]